MKIRLGLAIGKTGRICCGGKLICAWMSGSVGKKKTAQEKERKRRQEREGEKAYQESLPQHGISLPYPS